MGLGVGFECLAACICSSARKMAAACMRASSSAHTRPGSEASLRRGWELRAGGGVGARLRARAEGEARGRGLRRAEEG
eukprot:scaffold6213_cov51-Phaeocystis_antarctica.AAC.5